MERIICHVLKSLVLVSNLKRLKAIKSNNSFSLRSLVFLIVLLFVYSSGIAQGMEGASGSGSLTLTKGMPKLEMRIIDNDNVASEVYPGMGFSIKLLIKNNGRETARECQLQVESDSPKLFATTSEWGIFDLEPADSVIRLVDIRVDRSALHGMVQLGFAIKERNGYDLFPARTVSMNIQDAPAARVLVSDYAIRDQAGIGYFEQFQDVELFFRIQNCGFQALNNINVRMQLHPGVEARQLNPNFSISSLQPGQFRDISAVVSTGIMSENISLDIHINHESNSTVQSFHLKSRQDYKTPDRLSQDNCSQIYASSGNDNSESNEPDLLPARSFQNNKYAVIISNKNHYSADSLGYALSDASLFVSMLKTQLGFRDENIITLTQITSESFPLIKDYEQFNAWKRTWKRLKQPAELIFYFIGYGSIDNYNGNVFLLPINFSPFRFQSRINTMDVYNWLNNWKQSYNLDHVSVIFNLKIWEKSMWGQKQAEEFKMVQAHRDLPGFSTLLSANFNQSAMVSGSGNTTMFTEFMVNGMKGAADFNKDRNITLSEIHRFMSDELKGIPAKSWDLYREFSVPVFLGEEHSFY